MDKSTLISYIPAYYQDSKVVDNIIQIYSNELSITENKVVTTNNQLCIVTADNELKKWEKQFGIKTDVNKTIAERRAVLLAKVRGQGTSTIKQMTKVCLSFVSDVEIVEHNKASWFEINIIIHGELPYTLDSLYKVIEEIKPAHLEVMYNIMTINNGDLYIGTATVSQEKITIYPQEVF